MLTSRAGQHDALASADEAVEGWHTAVDGTRPSCPLLARSVDSLRRTRAPGVEAQTDGKVQRVDRVL